MNATKSEFPHCCGVNVIGGFSDHLNFGNVPIEKIGSSGTGLLVATFTNTENQRLAYEELRKKFTILYQSPPRRNRYSGSKVILVVYGPKSRAKKTEQKEGSSASWPAPAERRGEKLPSF